MPEYPSPTIAKAGRKGRIGDAGEISSAELSPAHRHLVDSAHASPVKSTGIDLGKDTCSSEYGHGEMGQMNFSSRVRRGNEGDAIHSDACLRGRSEEALKWDDDSVEKRKRNDVPRDVNEVIRDSMPAADKYALRNRYFFC